MNQLLRTNKDTVVYNALLHAAFESELTAILFGKPAGGIIEANQAACNMFGYDKASLLQLSRHDLMVSDNDYQLLSEERTLKGKASGIIKLRRKNGTVFSGKFDSRCVKDNMGIQYSCITITDLSAQEQLEINIREKDNDLNYILNSSIDIIAVINNNGQWKFVSKAAENILGYQLKDMIGKPFISFVHKDDIQNTLDITSRLHQLKTVNHFENRLVKRDGSFVNMAWSYNPDPQTGDIYSTGRDISEQKNTQLLLREREERSRFYIEQTNDAFFVHDFEGNIIEINERAAVSLGYTHDELLQLNVANLEANFSLAELQQYWSSLLPGQSYTLEGAHKKKDQTVFPVEVKISCFEEADKQYFLVLVTDISVRREAELVLKESEHRFRSLIENLTIGIVKQSPATEILISNLAALEMLGLTEDQLLGKTTFDPDWNIIHEDGSNFPAATHPVQVAITTKKKVKDVIMGVYRPLTKDRIWLLVNSEPVLNPDDSLDYAVTTFIDITEQLLAKQELENGKAKLASLYADLKIKTAALLHKNAELESFTHTASNDLQEPLRMVRSFLKLIEKKYNDVIDEKGKQYIHLAINGAEKMKTLIDSLLEYSHSGVEAALLTAVDMNDVMKEVQLSLSHALDRCGGKIYVENLPVIKAGENPMFQLMQNLLGNALKYRGHEKPVITVTATEKNAHWIFSVKDNGIGVDPEDADKIFILFQHLNKKTASFGTGIGLATSKKIVEAYGGEIWVESEPGTGADFKFSIPK